MGAIKDRAIDFLENGGYDLDYDAILYHKIPVWEYFGKTQEEYYLN